jgi:hypothetical protein
MKTNTVEIKTNYLRRKVGRIKDIPKLHKECRIFSNFFLMEILFVWQEKVIKNANRFNARFLINDDNTPENGAMILDNKRVILYAINSNYIKIERVFSLMLEIKTLEKPFNILPEFTTALQKLKSGSSFINSIQSP